MSNNHETTGGDTNTYGSADMAINYAVTFNQPNCKYKLIIYDGCVLYMINRPNALHRLIQRLMLGWKWEEI